MAKQSGIAMTTLSVDNSAGVAKDIRNDVTDWDLAIPRATQDVTGVDKSAMERLLLLADFTVSLKGVFNPATDKSHDVFKTVSSSSAQRTVTIAVGGVSLPNECIFTDYSWKRGQDGSLVWEAPGSLADGTVPTWA